MCVCVRALLPKKMAQQKMMVRVTTPAATLIILMEKQRMTVTRMMPDMVHPLHVVVLGGHTGQKTVHNLINL